MRTGPIWRRLARRLEKSINALGFAARIETINTLDAYLGSLPGHGVENVRRPLLNSLNLADLLPTSHHLDRAERSALSHVSAQFPGTDVLRDARGHALSPQYARARCRAYLRVRPDRLGQVHAAGRHDCPGAPLPGHDALLLRQGTLPVSFGARRRGAALHGGGGRPPGCAPQSGPFQSGLSFCPLQFLDSQSDRAWAMEWIDALLALNGLVTTPAQRNEIGLAIAAMHKTGSKTLSEFYTLIQDAAVRETLKVYTVEGAMGHLLDAQEDGLDLVGLHRVRDRGTHEPGRPLRAAGARCISSGVSRHRCMASPP